MAYNSTFKKGRSWHQVSSLHGKYMGNNGNSDRLFSWVPESLQIVIEATELKDANSLEEKL